jgi:putative transposase
MPNYARVFMPGGTFFFTLVTYQRHPIFQQKQARHCLNSAFQEILQNKPFEIISIVLLPDHLHCVWTLPEGDNDFSTRWRWIKTQFTRKYGKFCNDERGLSQSRKNKQERGFWQRRFWEHMIRDEKELAAVCNYIHYNPVKHGYVQCVHQWPHSTFHRFVAAGKVNRAWGCSCEGGICLEEDNFVLSSGAGEPE